jgi:hypothetical protein
MARITFLETQPRYASREFARLGEKERRWVEPDDLGEFCPSGHIPRNNTCSTPDLKYPGSIRKCYPGEVAVSHGLLSWIGRASLKPRDKALQLGWLYRCDLAVVIEHCRIPWKSPPLWEFPFTDVCAAPSISSFSCRVRAIGPG